MNDFIYDPQHQFYYPAGIWSATAQYSRLQGVSRHVSGVNKLFIANVDSPAVGVTPETADSGWFEFVLQRVTGDKGAQGLKAPAARVQYSADNVTYRNTYIDGDNYRRVSYDNGANWVTERIRGPKGNKGDTPVVRDGIDGTNAPRVIWQYAANPEGPDDPLVWRDTYVAGDVWKHYSNDGGTSWGDPERILGKDGRDGFDLQRQYATSSQGPWEVDDNGQEWVRERIGDIAPFGPPYSRSGHSAGLPTGAGYIYKWDDIKDGNTAIPADTTFITSNHRMFVTKIAIPAGNAIRNTDPNDFGATENSTYFQSVRLEDVAFHRSATGAEEYTVGKTPGNEYRETEVCFVLDVSSNAIDRALKVSESEGILLIKKKTGNTPPAVDAFDSSTYDTITLIGNLNGTPEVGVNMVVLDALKTANTPTNNFALAVVDSTLKWLKFVQPKDLFSQSKFWSINQNATPSAVGEWTFKNASNAVVNTADNALTSTEVSSIRFFEIHENVFPNSDYLNAIANLDNSTAFDSLLTNGGILYIHDTDASNYGAIAGDYFIVTITATGSSKTGSFYRFACTVTQVGSVWNGGQWYAMDFDVVSQQLLQAQQLVDVQTLFAKTLKVQETDQLLIMDGNGVLGNIKTDTLLSRKVDIAALIGDDRTDFYSQYQALTALLDTQTINKRGAWGFGTNTTGAPTTADTINQDQVNDGNYTLVLGATQQNSNWSFKSPAYTASDFSDGDILYAHPYDPYDAENYYKLTLTSDATLVGTGNAAYLWMSVTVDEVGSVTSASDGWRITETPPTSILAGLRGRLPVAGTPSLTQNSKILLENFQVVDLANLGENIIPRTTAPLDAATTWETQTGNLANDGNLVGIFNPIQNGVGQLVWSAVSSVTLSGGGTILRSQIRSDYLNAHHKVKVYNSDSSKILKADITGTFSGGLNDDKLYISIANAVHTGNAFTDGESVVISMNSRLVDREEFAPSAFLVTEPKFVDWTPALENTQGANTFTQNWVEYKIEEYASEKRVTIRLDITASHSSNANFSACRLDLPAVPGTGTTPSRVTCFGNPINGNFKKLQCGVVGSKIRILVEKQANDGNNVNFNAEIHYKTAA